jgi:hypothetical protein
MKAFREERRARGRCTNCGVRPGIVGRLGGFMCQECRTKPYDAKEQARLRKERESQGLCAKCGLRPGISGPKGGVICAACRALPSQQKAKQREYEHRLSERQRTQGVCTVCGVRAGSVGPSGGFFCEPCRRYGGTMRQRTPKKRQQKYAASYIQRGRLAAIAKYGGDCSQCGMSDPDVLEFHHCNGRANDQSARGRKGGRRWFEELVREPIRDDILLLCANCHRKHHRLARQSVWDS